MRPRCLKNNIQLKKNAQLTLDAMLRSPYWSDKEKSIRRNNFISTGDFNKKPKVIK
jgi:hypothetical protein|tara:strand:+ start:1657 stop:1824 length:168 start_codon:yes stop_codon:yes gene_type:complete